MERPQSNRLPIRGRRTWNHAEAPPDAAPEGLHRAELEDLKERCVWRVWRKRVALSVRERAQAQPFATDKADLPGLENRRRHVSVGIFAKSNRGGSVITYPENGDLYVRAANPSDAPSS